MEDARVMRRGVRPVCRSDDMPRESDSSVRLSGTSECNGKPAGYRQGNRPHNRVPIRECVQLRDGSEVSQPARNLADQSRPPVILLAGQHLVCEREQAPAVTDPCEYACKPDERLHPVARVLNRATRIIDANRLALSL